MYYSNNSQRYCVNCGNTGGIMVCDGCQMAFCSKHTIKHRQDLSYQLEAIMQDHNVIKHNISRSANEYLNYQKINRWEQESIKKIKLTAEVARNDLRQTFEKSRKQLSRMSQEMFIRFNNSMKMDDFSEKDLSRWAQQLNNLRSDMKSLYSVELIEDQRFPIYPLTVTYNKSQYTNRSNPSVASNPFNPNTQDLFAEGTQSASIENGGTVARHIGPDLSYAHILGKQIYAQGRHTTRFKIVQCTLPYIIFFGCVSTEVLQEELNYNSSSVVGWFGYNEIYQHGVWNNNFDLHRYDSNQIQKNDVLELTLDCDQCHIELFHERQNKVHMLQVDLDKAPLPWKILLVLVHEDDYVKILPRR